MEVWGLTCSGAPRKSEQPLHVLALLVRSILRHLSEPVLEQVVRLYGRVKVASTEKLMEVKSSMSARVLLRPSRDLKRRPKSANFEEGYWSNSLKSANLCRGKPQNLVLKSAN